MLPRTLEPEVMDTEEEARDYDAMDHREVNARFCDDLLRFAKESGAKLERVLDVGTGTALIPIELCGRDAKVRVEAIDLAEHMLAVGAKNVAAASLGARIALHKKDAKHTGFGDGAFAAVMSNSIVHHIPEPADVLREMWKLLSPGGVLFVRDLARPESDARVEQIVDTYAPKSATGDAKTDAMFDRQRDLFAASLRAALTPDELRAMVAPLGIAASAVAMTSDRHWTLAAKKG
jgi:ubiquinone/menaquinone biosynthesis C-methylase UbiE